MNKLGENIKKLRGAYKITTKQLANDVGIKRPYVSHIESGKKTPSLEVLQNIARVLNSTVSELIGEVPQQLNESQLKLMNAAKDLNPSQVDSLIGIIKAFIKGEEK